MELNWNLWRLGVVRHLRVRSQVEDSQRPLALAWLWVKTNHRSWLITYARSGWQRRRGNIWRGRPLWCEFVHTLLDVITKRGALNKSVTLDIPEVAWLLFKERALEPFYVNGCQEVIW